MAAVITCPTFPGQNVLAFFSLFLPSVDLQEAVELFPEDARLSSTCITFVFVNVERKAIV